VNDEIPPPEFPPVRRTHAPLPAHRYLPGVGPNPATLGWAPVPDFAWACDLFDHRHYWEAHEVWEAEWRTLDRDDPEKWLLQGLICGAAFTIKHHQGLTDAADRILARARASLQARIDATGPRARGLDLGEVLLRLDRFRGGGPWPVLPRD
jgi:hypothetical protein